MGYLKAFIISAVVALAIVFMIQNIEPLSHPLTLKMDLLFASFQSSPYPTYLLILFSFFFGLLLASLVGLMERFRLKSALKALRKQNASLANEVKTLRNLPLTGESMPVSGPPAVQEEAPPAEEKEA
ncbi:MAG: DUF1049 domain-containing protein [Deltaproteobacteria bacterium]|nr:DUF1049 domain-containing protein [Deltaproteobacteria bacterium]